MTTRLAQTHTTDASAVLVGEGSAEYTAALIKKREGAIVMYRAVQKQLTALHEMIRITEAELKTHGLAVKREFAG